MPAPTVAFELYDAIYDYLNQSNIPDEQVCDALGIGSRREGLLHGRIPLSLYEQAYLVAEELTGDHSIGLRIGQAAMPSNEGVFYFLSIAGEDVRQIMSAITRYFPLAYDFINLDMSMQENALRIELHYAQRRRPHRHVIEHLFANWYTIANQLTFDVQNVPRTLYLQHQQHCSDDLKKEIFQQTPVLFGQEADRFDLNLDSLNYHTGHINRRVFKMSEKRAENLLLRLRANDRIAREISTHVIAMLAEGLPTLDAVAQRMNCSGRTLQRRLSERHLNYQMLLDHIRQEVAIELLANTALPITQIAERIGFTDDSTFHRAFKRWTGESPGTYRH